MRRAARDGLVVAALVALALLLLEGAARLLEAPSARTRALAFEPPPPRAANAFRVFAFGSSVVYGLPVPELGVVAQLEYWLQQSLPERPVEVFNYAVPGREAARILEALRTALPWGPDLVFLHTGFGAFLRPEPEAAATRVPAGLLRHSALVRRLRRWAGETRVTPGERRRERRARGPYRRGSEEYRRRMAVHHRDLAAGIEAVRRAGVPLLLSTSVSNLADWPPANRALAVRLYEPGFPATLDALDASLAAGDWVRARALLARAQAVHPDDALLRFQQGKLQQARGDADRARALFYAARDADPMPWRVVSETNEFLRRAAEAPGVHLVDAERALERGARDALVGFELVLDNMHPSPRGSWLVARETLRVMAERGLGIAGDAAVFAHPAPLATFRAQAERRSAADLRSQLLAKTALYCMKYPFWQHRAARRYLEELAAREPGVWQTWANLATASFHLGELERGRRELARAWRANDPRSDMLGSRDVPFLAEALARAGLRCAFPPGSPPRCAQRARAGPEADPSLGP